MRELPKEVIELIEKKRFTIASALPFSASAIYRMGMKEALTNPSILEAANLVSKEEMFRFVDFLYNHRLDFQAVKTHTLIGLDLQYYTTYELFEIYLKQKP